MSNSKLIIENVRTGARKPVSERAWKLMANSVEQGDTRKGYRLLSPGATSKPATKPSGLPKTPSFIPPEVEEAAKKKALAEAKAEATMISGAKVEEAPEQATAAEVVNEATAPAEDVAPATAETPAQAPSAAADNLAAIEGITKKVVEVLAGIGITVLLEWLRFVENPVNLLGFSLPENLVNPLRKHLLALIGYVQRGLIPQLYSSSLILDRCKDEYENATLLCRKINELLHIQCPATEVVWLCLFLKECRHYRQRIDASPDCGVILIAHGATTATSQAQYVNRVLEREVFSAIDMPFEQSVHDTLEALTQMIQTRQYRRLILMVDIGSLVHFGSTISKLFQIDVLLMPNITLTSLLEIGLDLSYETSDLPQLAALMQSKNIPCQLCTPQQENSGKVLVISCITGMGTAEKIKKVLEESFGELMSQDTRMVILDYNEVRSLERVQQAINASERLAGIVGTFQPGLPDIPFISLEELFSEQGPELVLSLLTPDLSSSERRLEMERSAMRFISALTMESIINHISVLNPQRILKEMEGVLNHLTTALSLKPSRQVTLRFLIHCCCMVERIVINRKPLQMALENKPDLDNRAFSVIKSAFLPIEEAYAIRLSDAEYFYIYELLYS